MIQPIVAAAAPTLKELVKPAAIQIARWTLYGMAIGGGIAGFCGGLAVGYTVFETASDVVLWPLQAVKRRIGRTKPIIKVNVKQRSRANGAAVPPENPTVLPDPTPTPA